jgi:hypothetical protein
MNGEITIQMLNLWSMFYRLARIKPILKVNHSSVGLSTGVLRKSWGQKFMLLLREF